MNEMARFLVGNDGVDSPEVRSELHGIENFGDVANALGEGPRARRPRGVLGEKLAVFFERAAAAGCIDDVDVGAAAFERFDVPFCEVAPQIHLAGVHRDRAAAALVARKDDGESGALQHAHRGFVHLWKRPLA